MIRDLLRDAIREGIDLVFPSPCVVCDGVRGPVCPLCIPRATLVHRTIGTLHCISGAHRTPESARIMVALKERGVTGVVPALVPALRAALADARARMPQGARSAALLVPVPTRAGADRTRGFRPVEALLRACEEPFVRALRANSRAHDQRVLSREERRHNVAGAFRVRKSLAGASVILVDDVVTTGATLEAAADTLRRDGVSVVAAVTALSTPKRRT